MIQRFNEKFPEVSTCVLLKQNCSFVTNDNSIHYINNQTNKIYSWNYIDNKWFLNTYLNNYIDELFDSYIAKWPTIVFPNEIDISNQNKLTNSDICVE